MVGCVWLMYFMNIYCVIAFKCCCVCDGCAWPLCVVYVCVCLCICVMCVGVGVWLCDVYAMYIIYHNVYMIVWAYNCVAVWLCGIINMWMHMIIVMCMYICVVCVCCVVETCMQCCVWCVVCICLGYNCAINMCVDVCCDVLLYVKLSNVMLSCVLYALWFVYIADVICYLYCAFLVFWMC